MGTEREGNCEGYGQSYGNGKGAGILSMKKIAGESEKVFARILDESFKCLDLPKISVFSRRTIQNFKTLTPHLVF